MMRELWRRIRYGWTWTDTTVFGVNLLVFGVLIGNCWWEAVFVVYGYVSGALLALAIRWRFDREPLGNALVFGCLVGCLWPFGEFAVVKCFGWWGQYLSSGPKLLETPWYCIIIGCLASTHCYYVGIRTVEIGYGRWASGFASGITALGMGVVGENLFAAARMWEYVPSSLDWWAVPAFVPVAYGISYAIIPLLGRFHIVVATVIFTGITLVVSVGLGLAVGFFPQG